MFGYKLKWRVEIKTKFTLSGKKRHEIRSIDRVGI